MGTTFKIVLSIVAMLLPLAGAAAIQKSLTLRGVIKSVTFMAFVQGAESLYEHGAVETNQSYERITWLITWSVKKLQTLPKLLCIFWKQ